MSEITDAEAVEVLWASSEEGKAAFRAAWQKLQAMGLHQHMDMTQLGQIVYAAHLATADSVPGRVFLATAGQYSDFRVLHAFARREDAESYKLGDEVMEFEVREGPVETRTWYTLRWQPEEKNPPFPVDGNPWVSTETRDFDGDGKHAEHQWLNQSGLHVHRMLLIIGGWDLSLVEKVYSEQRAQYLARKEGVS